MTSFLIISVRASPSKVGRAMRAAERFMRAMFMSGRKRRTVPSSLRYAFVPSNRQKA